MLVLDFLRYLIANCIWYIPIVILLLCVYGKDRQRKEKRIRFMLLLFGAGALMAFPVIGLDAIRLKLLRGTDLEAVGWIRMATAVLVIVAEQIAAVKVIKRIIWKSKDFQNSYDAIVYSVLLSLGYSLATSKIPILVRYGEGDLTLISNLMLMPTMRACFAVFRGIHIAKAKYSELTEDKANEREHMFSACLTPGILQGICCLIVSGVDFLLDTASYETPTGDGYNAALAMAMLMAYYWMIAVGIYALFVYIPALVTAIRESKAKFWIINPPGEGQMLYDPQVMIRHGDGSFV